ncbi:Uncharacterized protein TCM_018124 [Theobroma cacao]|uniref:Uncharacterized protein n=1 Tax=Theobroma cacao TaxID=3641 RepID=A0A061EE79_THECC|nr:Uncharacterized protein TCM_018124 [Theobroma cacao]
MVIFCVINALICQMQFIHWNCFCIILHFLKGLCFQIAYLSLQWNPIFLCCLMDVNQMPWFVKLILSKL